MINVKKTKNGILGYGTIDGEEFVKAFLSTLGLDEDEEEEIEEIEPEETECDEEYEPVEESEIVENEHLVSIGYNDADNIVVINHDEAAHPWSVASALLEAAALMWPLKIETDKKLVAAMKELAEMGRDIGDAWVEDDK